MIGEAHNLQHILNRVASSKFNAKPYEVLQKTFVFDIQKRLDYSNLGMTKSEYDELQDSQMRNDKVKNLLKTNQDIRKQRDVDNKKKSAEMLE